MNEVHKTEEEVKRFLKNNQRHWGRCYAHNRSPPDLQMVGQVQGTAAVQCISNKRSADILSFTNCVCASPWCYVFYVSSYGFCWPRQVAQGIFPKEVNAVITFNLHKPPDPKLC